MTTDVRAAYRRCEEITWSQARNFSYGIRLLPPAKRQALAAVYAFARRIDDIGDGTLPPAEKLAALEEARVGLSANPVGRIVLYVFGSFSPPRAELSDSICTALQLAEHWQDVAEDLHAGRIYLPAQDMDTFGCTEQDLAQPSAPPQVRKLIAFETRRAKALLDAGAPLIGTLRGTARAAVAGYVAGGRAALAGIAAADHDVLRATPRPRKRRMAAELALAYVRGR